MNAATLERNPTPAIPATSDARLPLLYANTNEDAMILRRREGNTYANSVERVFTPEITSK